MTQPTQHATTQDINAILAARKAAAIAAAKIPAAPISQPKPVQIALPPTKPGVPVAPVAKPATPIIHAQGIVPAAPVSDTDLSSFLSGHLPALISAAQAVVTGPFAFSEVLTLSQVVSQAVHDGLPLAKGAEAAQLVNVIAAYIWDKYATPILPSSVKLFAPVLRSLMLAGIEAAYRFGVKKIGAKPA